MFISSKKAKLLAGKFNVYGVYDKISKHYLRLYFNSSDEDFIRLYLPEIVRRTPLRDLEVYCIGTFNDVTGIIEKSTKRKINLKCYYFPHSRLSPPGENTTHEEIEETINRVANQLKAAASTVVEDNNSNESEDTKNE